LVFSKKETSRDLLMLQTEEDQEEGEVHVATEEVAPLLLIVALILPLGVVVLIVVSAMVADAAPTILILSSVKFVGKRITPLQSVGIDLINHTLQIRSLLMLHQAPTMSTQIGTWIQEQLITSPVS
jgi:type III secretory pathway component EscU